MSTYKNDIINNYIYFYHLDKFCILPVYPEQIADKQPTKFQQTNALSRSAPVFTFSDSGPRQVNFSFDLHRDLMNAINTDCKVQFLESDVVDFSKDDYVDTLIKYVQAAAIPNYQVYNGGKNKSVDPPMVALRLATDIFVKGVVTSGMSVVYKKPILDNGKYALVTLDFTISEVEPYDAKTVVEKGSFRDIAAGFRVDRFNG